jgi:hypothetical protein
MQACSSGSITTKDEPLPLKMANPVAINRFKLTVTTEKANITGIMPVKFMDGVWKGSLINEFGVKVFDFVSTPKKCRLINVISFIDRWYIRKMIADDLQLLLEIDKPAYKAYRQAKRDIRRDTLKITHKSSVIRRFPDNNIRLENQKRGVVYQFSKIND